MGWFSSSSSSHHKSSRPSYARSYAGSSYSSHSHRSSTSRYKRSPRDGYIAYLVHKLKSLWHQIWSYARRHPFKVFFMVIMPLISGGVLHKIAGKMGVNLPDMGQRAAGSRSMGGDGGYYGSRGYGGDDLAGGMMGGGGFGSIEKLASGIGALGSVAKVAQAFI